MIIAEITFGGLMLACLISAVVGGVVTALVFRKNPKIQADVNTAAGQVSSAAQAADSTIKKL